MLLTQSNEVKHDENLPNVMDGVCEAEGSTHYLVWSAQAQYKPTTLVFPSRLTLYIIYLLETLP
jgi:hypothetical protein